MSEFTVWYRRTDAPDGWWQSWQSHPSWQMALQEAQALLCVPAVCSVQMTDPTGERIWAMAKDQIPTAWAIAESLR